MCQQESYAEKPEATSLAYTEARRRFVTATFATRIELDDRSIAWIAGSQGSQRREALVVTRHRGGADSRRSFRASL